jgi:hypothetical protein
MSSARYLPPVSVAVTLGCLLSGRVRFPKDRVGRVLTTQEGEAHTVFRAVQVTSSRSVPVESMTVLRVRFKFARFSPTVNRSLSIIPIPVIIGMPGFRRKIWTFCEESGYSQGIYQFEWMDQAEGYGRSLVMRVLEKRSVPGSMSHELFTGTLIEDYLESMFNQ